ncbi:MAG TPA: oligosaccharide flippase family protein [Methylomirabilota bacterium]|nr:oligosaccharide flippase family protein [Methylomirabilota bacterium]
MNSDPDASADVVLEDDAIAADLATAPRIRPIGSREFASTLITNVVIQACTVVQGILVARLLGPVGRGQFAAAILWPSLFAAMGGMGVGVALARRAGRATDLARIIRTGLVLTLLSGTVAAALCAVAIPWLLPGSDTIVRNAAYVFVPYIIFNHVSLAMIAIDQGAGWFGQMNWTRLIVNPVYLALVIGLWLAGIRDVFWFVVSLLIAGGAVASVRVGLALRRAPLPGPMEPVKSVFREALPFGFAGLLNPLAASADKALLLYLLGTAQLGFYTVALTAASVVNSLAGAAGTVSFGMSAQVKDREGFDRIARMFRFTAWTWLLAGLGVAVIIPIVLPLLYGAVFRPAIWPAILLIPAAALTGQASILEESMRAQGRAFVGLEARAGGLVVMIAMGWLLAPVVGIYGVVFAAIGSQAIVLIVMMFAARWHFHRALLNTLLPRVHDLAELRNRARLAISGSLGRS